MLTTFKEIQGYEVFATDEKAGSVDDIYFDDSKWAVRYLVVNTGGWLHRKQVLISPWAVTEIARGRDAVQLNLTHERIEHSPEVQFDEPVSRQMEKKYFDYYAWPYYWEGAGLWGPSAYPGFLGGLPTAFPHSIETPSQDIERESQESPPGDPHLRSARELIGYHIQAKNEEFGRVHDIVFDDVSWAIRYLVIDTSHWWSGKSVLIAPRWTSDIRWDEQKVHVDLSKDRILKSPPFVGLDQLDRDYEERLHEHYGFVEGKYWLFEEQPTVIHKPERHPNP